MKDSFINYFMGSIFFINYYLAFVYFKKSGRLKVATKFIAFSNYLVFTIGLTIFVAFVAGFETFYSCSHLLSAIC